MEWLSNHIGVFGLNRKGAVLADRKRDGEKRWVERAEELRDRSIDRKIDR